MKNIFSLFLTKKGIFIILAVVAVGAVIIQIFSNGNQISGQVQVKRGTVLSEIRASGRTKPAQEVALAFEISGRVAAVNVGVGGKVKKGQLLAALDSQELNAKVAEAVSAVIAEQANLDEINAGTRPEEIAVSEQKLDSAVVSRQEARRNLVDKLQDAYTKSDDAVRNKADQVFYNPRTNPDLKFSVFDSQLEINLVSARVALEAVLNEWDIRVGAIVASDSNIAGHIVPAKQYLEQVRLFLDLVASAVNSAQSTPSLSQATIDAWRADIATGRVNVNTAINNLSSAEEKLRSADAALAVAQQELALAKAGPTESSVALQVAKLEQAKAKLLQARAQLSHAFIYAPFDGIVTRQDFKIGQSFGAHESEIALISDGALEIEANIPELDIGSIQNGNFVRIKMDAYSGEEFTGEVVFIEPAETIIDGVVNFKVKIAFSGADQRLKSGLTVDLNIETGKKENVLFIPEAMVTRNNGKTIVRKLEGKTIAEVQVGLGIRNREGMVEVLNGLKENDIVVGPEQ